jgi:ferrochelatase
VTREKLAVVLFNLGGPDRPEAIAPFLKNLFSDPAILRVPFFVRPLLARMIAGRRLRPATENYAILGGRSPLLELTERQARALEAALPDFSARCFIAMRYWHPFSDAAARAVRAWDPDSIMLLPLYPQFSTTTTGSSLSAWRDAAARVGLAKPTAALCCYPAERHFAAATAALVARHLAQARREGEEPRVLFSAHGLPESIVRAGDPYQMQVERSVAAVLEAMGPARPRDVVTCYQSRATPERWIGPSTDEAIVAAGQAGRPVLVVPIAFVSEHSETLVELDVEYRELAERSGVPAYFRVPTQNDDADFVAALAAMVRATHARGAGLWSYAGGRACGAAFRDCPHARAGRAPMQEAPAAVPVRVPEPAA